jgi:hypothetical protein
MKNGSLDLAVQNREFPLREVDRGARSGLTGGRGMKMGSSEIFGFSVAGEVKLEFAAGKKIEESYGNIRDFRWRREECLWLERQHEIRACRRRKYYVQSICP